jgi:hypothetical protein
MAVGALSFLIGNPLARASLVRPHLVFKSPDMRKNIRTRLEARGADSLWLKGVRL